MLGLFKLLFAGLLLAEGLAVAWTMYRMRRPPRRTYASAVARGEAGDPSELDDPLDFTEWLLRAPGGAELPVWDVKGRNESGPTVVFTPGWGDSRLGALPRITHLAESCARFIAWDPPGMGEAPGLCALGIREPRALLALVERVREGDAERPVFLYGWSLGAGVSIAAGARARGAHGVTGVVAEAPYRVFITPARNMMRRGGMPYRANLPVASWTLGARLGVGPRWKSFDRAAHARRLKAPLLVIHGSRDGVCPIEDGRAIADAAPQGIFVSIEGGEHNDLWTDEGFARQSSAAVRDFLRAAQMRTDDARTMAGQG